MNAIPRPLKIIGAEERLREQRGAKILLTGFPGAGKTSQLRCLDPARTLFVDVEAGDLAVADVATPTVRIDDWPSFRDLVVRLGGPNPSFPDTCCFSEAHYRAAGGPFPDLETYQTIFVNSLTALSRLAYRWCEQQPEAFSERSGAKDIRATYGLLAREMIVTLQHLQHIRGKNIVLVAILEKIIDEFHQTSLQIQMEGTKSGRELPGIVDEIVTLSHVDFGDGKLVRAFVCTSPNPWNFPAKDRSGKLGQVEEPHLGRLIKKLTGPQAESRMEK